jgi:hypothetical protein
MIITAPLGVAFIIYVSAAAPVFSSCQNCGVPCTILLEGCISLTPPVGCAVGVTVELTEELSVCDIVVFIGDVELFEDATIVVLFTGTVRGVDIGRVEFVTFAIGVAVASTGALEVAFGDTMERPASVVCRFAVGDGVSTGTVVTVGTGVDWNVLTMGAPGTPKLN